MSLEAGGYQNSCKDLVPNWWEAVPSGEELEPFEVVIDKPVDCVLEMNEQVIPRNEELCSCGFGHGGCKDGGSRTHSHWVDLFTVQRRMAILNGL